MKKVHRIFSGVASGGGDAVGSSFIPWFSASTGSAGCKKARIPLGIKFRGGKRSKDRIIEIGKACANHDRDEEKLGGRDNGGV